VKALNPYRLEPGSHAPAGPDQVVIDAGSAKDAGFKVGDEVTILTQGPPTKYQIVGIAKFGDADSAAGASAALFDTSTAQSITGAIDQFDSISVVAQPGVSQTRLKDRIAAQLDNKTYQVLTGAQITKENQSDIKNALQFFNVALLVFALIALFVGTFIIFNTFSIVVAQRLRELALLRALGASGRQVMGSVLTEAVLVGLSASVIGLGAGIALSSAEGTARRVRARHPGRRHRRDCPDRDRRPRRRYGRDDHLCDRAGPEGITGAPDRGHARRRHRGATPFRSPCRDRVRHRRSRRLVAVRGAVRRRRHPTRGPRRVDRVHRRLRAGARGRPSTERGHRLAGARLRGITGSLARDNAMRNPKRTSATAAALMIGVALVGFITIFAASAKESINAQVDEAFKADYVITTGSGFGASFGGFSPQLASDIAKLPQVAGSSPLRFNQAEFGGSSEFFAGVDPRSATKVFNMKVQDGSVGDLAQANSVGISRSVANDKHWRLGSRVPAQFPNGTTPLTVRTIYGNGNKQGFADYTLSIATVSEHYTSQLDQFVFAKLASGVSPVEGRQAIDRVLKAYPNAKLQDSTEFKDSQAAQINQLLGLIYVMLLLAVIIALIGIANTLALSIYERTRELGLLRAVGMSRRQLRSSIRWESVIISLLGTFVGLVLWFVLRLGRHRSAQGPGLHEVRGPAGS
jgi:putative ABC transport system permease protein